MCSFKLIPLALLSATASAQTASDTSSLTARLGVDTIAVERIVRARNTVDAEIVVRSPRTSLQRHRVEFGSDGMLSRLEVTVLDPATAAVTRRTVFAYAADSIRVADEQGTERTSRAVGANRAALPFIDLVHWPFEIALRRLRASGASAIEAPMLSGARISAFPLSLLGADSATVAHPTRGTMRLRVDRTPLERRMAGVCWRFSGTAENSSRSLPFAVEFLCRSSLLNFRS